MMILMIPHKTKPIVESVTVYKIDNVRYRIISLNSGIVIKTIIRDINNVGSISSYAGRD
jgi:hypothetical protein